MDYDVFISYRREGGYDTAKHLNDLLVMDGLISNKTYAAIFKSS